MATIDEEIEFNGGFCTYFNLNNLSNRKFVNSFMHLNVRSVSPKLPEIQGLLSFLGFPKNLYVI